jgi:hypothetical protein
MRLHANARLSVKSREPLKRGWRRVVAYGDRRGGRSQRAHGAQVARPVTRRGPCDRSARSKSSRRLGPRRSRPFACQLA